MKKSLTIGLICLSIFSYGQQKLDIAIIGTVHHFQEEYLHLQDFEAVQKYIINFNPDLFCIEAIPSYDTLSLKEILPKVMTKADHLRDTLFQIGLLPIQSELWEGFHHHPNLLKGAQYYITYDIWNAFYLWDALKEEDSLSYCSNYLWKLDNSEFRHIIFPAARQLGIHQFYGIDYRAGESDFLQNNQQVMKKLLFKLKWKPLKIYLNIQKEYKKAEKQGTLLAFINSEKFQNSFSNLIDDLPRKLPKSEEAKAIKAYWLKRNRIMTDRLVTLAQQQYAKKVLLTVGSAHVTHMKHFLEAQGHHVTTFRATQSDSKKQ